MWQVLTALVALIGVLLTANGPVGGQARTRHRLKQELELIDHMPTGLAGREAFETYVSEALQVYVDEQEQRSTSEEDLTSRRLVGRVLFFMGAAIALGTVVVILSLRVADPDNLRGYSLSGWLWVGAFGLLVEYVGGTMGTRAANQLALRKLQLDRREGRRTETTPEADV